MCCIWVVNAVTVCLLTLLVKIYVYMYIGIYVYMYNVFVCAVYVCEGVRALINSNVCVS